jgi:hypothetical protein
VRAPVIAPLLLEVMEARCLIKPAASPIVHDMF